LGQPVDPAVIYRFGGWRAPAVVDGELWRLVTAIFLHFDLMHLIFNCIWLVHLGSLLERFLGRPRYLALYLGSGTAGFAVTVLAHLGAGPHVGAGASGVVFGLIGCALVLGYGRRGPATGGGQQGRRRHLPGTEVFRAGLLKWAIFATVISLLSGADHVAHFGGAAAGALMGLGLTPESQPGRRARPLWVGIELGLLAILVLSIGLAWAVAPKGFSG
jgi:rhomboid protease GluP